MARNPVTQNCLQSGLPASVCPPICRPDCPRTIPGPRNPVTQNCLQSGPPGLDCRPVCPPVCRPDCLPGPRNPVTQNRLQSGLRASVCPPVCRPDCPRTIPGPRNPVTQNCLQSGPPSLSLSASLSPRLSSDNPGAPESCNAELSPIRASRPQFVRQFVAQIVLGQSRGPGIL